jgi:carboxypeptidase C (cathepsin A)
MNLATSAPSLHPGLDSKTEPLPPLPKDASVGQTITLDGKTLHYTATVGVIPVYNRTDPGKAEIKSGEVVFTACTLDGVKDSTDRPVTFAMNGGPGGSSVYLNLGAIGPKHIQFAEQGDSPSDSARLSDNPGTWLPFSDLPSLMSLDSINFRSMSVSIG